MTHDVASTTIDHCTAAPADDADVRVIFSSRAPGELKGDPEPYVVYYDHSATDIRSSEWHEPYVAKIGKEASLSYEPRPEFDITPRNPSNPILVGVRGLICDAGGIHRDKSAFYRDAAEYLTVGTHANGVPIPAGASVHAQLVFSRLATFAALLESEDTTTNEWTD